LHFKEATLGNCKYCGNPAGFLRGKHKECEEKHQQEERVIQGGRQLIVSEATHAIRSGSGFDELSKKIKSIEQESLVPYTERGSLLVKAWENAVDKFLDDGILDESEEKRLMEFKEQFGLSQDVLNRNGALTKTTKSAVLRDVLGGTIPQRVTINGNLPINLQKSEQIVWAFPNSKYYEDKTRRTYVGGSQGVSVRVMKGVYYRTGSFKGRAVEHTERVHIDTGWVVVTSKNIYFAGPSKSTRIPYTKIVSFDPYSDGVGVMRDATTAKPQIFVTGDGWFTYNLVTNLAQL
jgi:hypothetical protein